MPLQQAKWLIEPGCVLLISSGSMENANVMTVSWQTPVRSGTPFRLLLVVRRSRYSHELIIQNNELVVNIPGEELLSAVHQAGVISGRNTDKFQVCGLSKEESEKVAPPRVSECAGHIECAVIQTVSLETHDLLICEARHAAADFRKFDKHWITSRHKTIHYMNSTMYGIIERTITVKDLPLQKEEQADG